MALHFKHLFKILKEENFSSTGNDWGNWGNSDSENNFVNNDLNATNTNNDMAMFNDKDPEDLIHSRMYENPFLATSHNLKDMAKYGQFDALVGNTMQRQKVKTFHKKKTISSKNETNNKNVEIKPWDDIGEEVGVYSDENIFGTKKLIGIGKILRRIVNPNMLYAYYLVKIKNENIIVNAHQIFPLEVLTNIKKISNIDDRKVKIAPFDNPFSKVQKKEENEIIRDIKDDVAEINQRKEIKKYFDNVDAKEIELSYDEAKPLGQEFSFDVMDSVKFIKKVAGNNIYHKVEESVKFKDYLNFQNLNECIGLVKKVKDEILVGLNRDKAMMPLYVIKREIINNVEVLYLEDTKTKWTQGTNEYGITLINTALAYNRERALTDVGDEIIDKTPAPNTWKMNGKTDFIFKLLSFKTIDDIFKSFENKHNRIEGHSILTNGEEIYSIEVTKKEKLMFVKKINKQSVITNHGLFFKKEGYQEKENPIPYISSITRKKDAEFLLNNTDNLFNILTAQNYKENSPNNILRNTKSINTNTSIVINATKREMNIKLYMNKIEGFYGVENNLPDNYDSKIKLTVDKCY